MVKLIKQHPRKKKENVFNQIYYWLFNLESGFIVNLSTYLYMVISSVFLAMIFVTIKNIHSFHFTYFEILVLMFIAIWSIHFADGKLSNLEGYFFLCGIGYIIGLFYIVMNHSNFITLFSIKVLGVFIFADIFIKVNRAMRK